MEDRIKQEVSKTLAFMGAGSEIQVSGDFAENLSRRIAGVRVYRGAWYRSRAFYPVVIALLIALNVAAMAIKFKVQETRGGALDNQASVLASEYGIGQGTFSL